MFKPAIGELIQTGAQTLAVCGGINEPTGFMRLQSISAFQNFLYLCKLELTDRKL